MKAEGIRQERETVINFNEEDDTCSIWTASDTIYRLGSEYLTEQGGRHAVFVFPAKWLVLPRKRAVKVLTKEQKASLAQKLALGRQTPLR